MNVNLMKKILFYYPSNKRSVQIESTLSELKKLGHEIILLTTCEKGTLHEELEANGIKSFSTNINSTNSFIYYLRNVFYLANFTKKHQVDLIFGNLQHANFIAVFAQYFTSAKLIAFRHHFKFNKGEFGISLKVNKNEIKFDKVINRLAKIIVVPSSGVYKGMMKFEKVVKKKVHLIPYIYDFSKYNQPTEESVQKIKDKYPARLRIIMVARLIPFKRHILLFPVFKKLIDEGFDLKVLILDEGPEKETLNNYITSNKLTESLIMVGFTKEFLAYMKASDLLLHPSITEASNSVVKEIGLLNKVVAVCRGVGDFDEYIEDRKNGYLMDIAQPQIDAEKIIKEIYQDSTLKHKYGEKIQQSIKKHFFDKTQIVQLYTNLIEITSK